MYGRMGIFTRKRHFFRVQMNRACSINVVVCTLKLIVILIEAKRVRHQLISLPTVDIILYIIFSICQNMTLRLLKFHCVLILPLRYSETLHYTYHIIYILYFVRLSICSQIVTSCCKQVTSCK